MPDVEVAVELRGAAREMFQARDPELVVSGPAGTGKTQAALLKIHLLCLSKPGIRCLIARKTHASLTASTLVTFRKKVAAEALAMNYVSYFGGSGAEPAAFRYVNGSSIVVGGLDKPTKLLSTEYDVILVDEAIETTPDDLDILVTRLRHGVLPYQQMIMLTNPGAPTHHLKVRADSGRSRMLYSRHQDNPSYYRDGTWTEQGAAYLERLGTLPGVRRQRFLLGQWVAAEGLIYEDFDPAVHLTDQFSRTKLPPPSWSRYLAVDFGFTNPAVFQWWAEDPDGRLYLYREIYKTKTLVEDHATQIKKLHRNEPTFTAVICDHDAEDRATLERHLGYSTVAAHKEVTPGIEAVKTRLRTAGDGKPRVFICRDALVERDRELDDARKPCSTAEELGEYVWDPSSPPSMHGAAREAPLKRNDHGCDALRYAVAQLDLVGRPRYRSFFV